MFALAFVVISALALGATAIAAHRAPEGYEDETGFHLTKEVGRGSGGAKRMLLLLFGLIGFASDMF
jgi:hypothetical protein